MEEYEVKWLCILGCVGMLAGAIVAWAPKNESAELQQLRLAIQQYQGAEARLPEKSSPTD